MKKINKDLQKILVMCLEDYADMLGDMGCNDPDEKFLKKNLKESKKDFIKFLKGDYSKEDLEDLVDFDENPFSYASNYSIVDYLISKLK